ncbi:MAG: 23S rRNA (uracil(1939)-C(5))-methyltransferase RlmD [Syntrophobacterales bacterium]|jgi:23S rRNA (uracil1939-C5)-methyltransferase|nr:23S rRNA (uracil(1939)-C(5))-methyltransferase RlmD [Syntrophobacterales bacterium]
MKFTELSLEIVDMALPDGYGVGRKDGFVFFVPGAVPGDRLKIKVTGQKKRFSYGEIFEIEEPSPDRRQPPCPYFGLCGGCTLQHMSYRKQLEVKERHLVQTLARIGHMDTASIAMLPIVPSPQHYFSRNKVEMAFGKDEYGLIAGLREGAWQKMDYEGKVISLGKCLAFSDCVEKILPPILDFFNGHRFLSYDQATKKGLLRRLVLKESKTTDEVMVILETSRGILPNMQDLWRMLSNKAPEVVSLWRAINTRRSDAGLYEKKEHLFGKRFIEESLGGLTFRIYPQSFFQPNSRIAETLYQAAMELGQPGPQDRVLGLYCGMGPIEMMFSRRTNKVTGVDSNPDNIANARENARINGIENCIFIEGMVERVGSRLPAKPEILVIDPPRGGISNKGCDLIARIEPGKIVYVSCNPSTLARDLNNLTKYGYVLRKVVPFDAFPQTGHLETVALVER